MLRRRAIVMASLVLLAAGATASTVLVRNDGPQDAGSAAGTDRRFATDDSVERACALEEELLVRIWRGHHRIHSEDVTIVPQEPNYSGSFKVTSHSGPWDYVQTVPLVAYGPQRIAATGTVKGDAGVVDLYPTIGRLAGLDFPARQGRVLTEALTGQEGVPRLVVLVVWDGVGRNVLDLWPDRWPNLARLEREGTSYVDATVGSSPSITPATHATMGTGAFPRRHGVTAIEYRDRSGEVRGVYPERNPSDLRLDTFADRLDLAFSNASKAGMVAWKSWHFGMFGHGAQTPGGDADHLALIGTHGDVSGNPSFFSTPDYLKDLSILEARAAELDLEDGARDRRWRGHDILEQHDNPAWVRYELDLTMRLLTNEGYGQDEIPDVFVTNYKTTDIVSHQHSIHSDEMGDVLEEQDRALGSLIDHLDREVGDYVVFVTSDHGNTPRAEITDAWPILQRELARDIDAHFGVPDGDTLVKATTAVGPFLDLELADRMGVEPSDVARFLNGYTIADNWSEDELPDAYEGRGDEHILSAAFAKDQIDEVMTCAFGSPRPPRSLTG